MTTLWEIPLTPSPQAFLITLSGATYQLVFTYRDTAMGGWVLDINTDRGAPIACGLPLVTGIDLLAQFRYLGLGGHIAVITDGDPDAVPSFDGLGASSRVYWVTNP